MSEVSEVIFYYVLTTIPYFIGAYIPFIGKLRFQKIYTVCVFLCFTISICFAAAFMCWWGVRYRIIEFTLAALYIVLYFFLVKQNPFKLMFFGVFIADAMIVIRGISLFLCYNIFGFDESMYVACGLVHMAVFIPVYPLMYLTVEKNIKVIFDVEGTKLWSTVWLLPLTITVIVFIYTYDISAVGVQKWQFILSRVLFGISVLLIYTIILKSLAQLREQTILKERADNASHVIQIYTERYDLLKSHIEETKKARHNLRQHFNLISACIEKNDMKALTEYVNKYIKSMPKSIKHGYSANYAVDTIVGWYAEQAEAKNIKFDVEIKIPSKINISEPELCVVLGNLIENAVNACEKVTETEPFIKIRGAVQGEDTVIFTVDNSCAEESSNKGSYLPQKGGNAGLGLQSVYDIAQKYNGIADFKCRNNIFFASVMLNGLAETA
ncbi:MAG: GHKL domain-containing protein [Clostridiales bacterium]|nr:GHKL domain-containing protein [Clostridiales bacterium]